MSISPETLALAKKYTEESLLGAGALKGQDGTTPHIGANGNWWIGNVDTGVQASGGGGDSGIAEIYVGSGDPPAGTKLKVDPNGVATFPMPTADDAGKVLKAKGANEAEWGETVGVSGGGDIFKVNIANDVADKTLMEVYEAQLAGKIPVAFAWVEVDGQKFLECQYTQCILVSDGYEVNGEYFEEPRFLFATFVKNGVDYYPRGIWMYMDGHTELASDYDFMTSRTCIYNGFIMVTPAGDKYRVSINSSGALATTKI